MQELAPVTEDTFDVKLLDPSDLRFFHAPEGDARLRLEFQGDRSFSDVRLSRALPLSDPDHYLAIRDADDKEVGVLVEWHALDPQSHAIVLDALEHGYFLPKVLKVNKVVDTFGVVVWDVDTDYGTKRYTIRNIRDSSVALSSKRVIMTSVDGERFEFPDIQAYSPAAIEILLKVL